VLVTYFSGIVDERDHVRLGGYPGAFRDLLGVRTEEFFPLLPGERVRLDDGTSADVWTEALQLAGAEAVASYADGVLAGTPALTRHRYGAGVAWYAATRLDVEGLERLTARLLTDTGVRPLADVPPGVEVIRRTGSDASYLFVLNHTEDEVTVATDGVDLLTGADVVGTLTVAAGGAAVVRERDRAARAAGS
jgi:beta-galactosidase